mmetsp:Transcript_19781/g.50258  ORF Transcript_19781/g.50258 Transcript_19781/m.50258 type:complete len:290 (-) Transcript_19781:86-955(-)
MTNNARPNRAIRMEHTNDVGMRTTFGTIDKATDSTVMSTVRKCKRLVAGGTCATLAVRYPVCFWIQTEFEFGKFPQIRNDFRSSLSEDVLWDLQCIIAMQLFEPRRHHQLDRSDSDFRVLINGYHSKLCATGQFNRQDEKLVVVHGEDLEFVEFLDRTRDRINLVSIQQKHFQVLELKQRLWKGQQSVLAQVNLFQGQLGKFRWATIDVVATQQKSAEKWERENLRRKVGERVTTQIEVHESAETRKPVGQALEAISTEVQMCQLFRSPETCIHQSAQLIGTLRHPERT